MSSKPDTMTIPALGLFSLYIGSRVLMAEAFTSLPGSATVPFRYICGSFPVLLPGILAQHRNIRITRIEEPDQIIMAIRESHEPYILVEHDASFYDTNADLIRSIGQTCRREVSEHQHSICMLASRPDGWLKRFEPFAHRVTYVDDQIRSMKSVPLRPSRHLPLLT